MRLFKYRMYMSAGTCTITWYDLKDRVEGGKGRVRVWKLCAHL